MRDSGHLLLDGGDPRRAAPNPKTPAGRAEIAGQKCEVCILENPGDGAPCYAICMQKEEDQAAYAKAYGR
jgi:hypothetical protein